MTSWASARGCLKDQEYVEGDGWIGFSKAVYPLEELVGEVLRVLPSGCQDWRVWQDVQDVVALVEKSGYRVGACVGEMVDIGAMVDVLATGEALSVEESGPWMREVSVGDAREVLGTKAYRFRGSLAWLGDALAWTWMPRERNWTSCEIDSRWSTMGLWIRPDGGLLRLADAMRAVGEAAWVEAVRTEERDEIVAVGLAARFASNEGMELEEVMATVNVFESGRSVVRAALERRAQLEVQRRLVLLWADSVRYSGLPLDIGDADAGYYVSNVRGSTF